MHTYSMCGNACTQGTTYAVFGLGNKQYEHFNAIGKKAFSALQALGAVPLLRRGDGDDDGCIDDDFDKWSGEFAEALKGRAGECGHAIGVCGHTKRWWRGVMCCVLDGVCSEVHDAVFALVKWQCVQGVDGHRVLIFPQHVHMQLKDWGLSMLLSMHSARLAIECCTRNKVHNGAALS
eukprot:196069-Pelagomonas_calceolata.AAC.2